MEGAPLEIILMIVKEVVGSRTHTFQDLRNLRLVNTTLALVVTPLLFQAVPVWIGINSLQHLTNISEHAHL